MKVILFAVMMAAVIGILLIFAGGYYILGTDAFIALMIILAAACSLDIMKDIFDWVWENIKSFIIFSPQGLFKIRKKKCS